VGATGIAGGRIASTSEQNEERGQPTHGWSMEDTDEASNVQRRSIVIHRSRSSTPG
jgi:hypothetical protein